MPKTCYKRLWPKVLLESSHELSFHKTCISYLNKKYLYVLPPELMTDIFILRKNPDNIRNIRLVGSENWRSVRFGVDVIGFGAR